MKISKLCSVNTIAMALLLVAGLSQEALAMARPPAYRPAPPISDNQDNVQTGVTSYGECQVATPLSRPSSPSAAPSLLPDFLYYGGGYQSVNRLCVFLKPDVPGCGQVLLKQLLSCSREGAYSVCRYRVFVQDTDASRPRDAEVVRIGDACPRCISSGSNIGFNGQLIEDYGPLCRSPVG